jgi:hypothetical protein
VAFLETRKEEETHAKARRREALPRSEIFFAPLRVCGRKVFPSQDQQDWRRIDF